MRMRRLWTAGVAAAAGVLVALSGAAAVEAQAVFTPERPPAPGTRIYANASVVRVDVKAHTMTVRGGGVGKDETFTVDAQAMPRLGALKPGQQVVLTLRAAAAGREVVTQVEGPVDGAGARTNGRAVARPPGNTAVAPIIVEPVPRTAPAPVASPPPSPAPTGLPTDIVGPFRDPRVDPNFDPRRDPLRDPRVIPGLSEPAPTPTPTPTPTPAPSANGASLDPE